MDLENWSEKHGHIYEFASLTLQTLFRPSASGAGPSRYVPDSINLRGAGAAGAT